MPDEPAKCKGEAKPTNNPTENGHWECQEDGWVWIAEIG